MPHRKKSPPFTPPARSDDGRAFLPDPGEGPARSDDDLAEALAESYLASATSGEEDGEEMHEQLVPEEGGGPYMLSALPAELGPLQRTRQFARRPTRAR